MSKNNVHFDLRANDNDEVPRNVKTVTIHPSVTTIGQNAFTNCSQLSSVVIPNSVTEIGRSAFEGCSQLQLVFIPDSVTEIGSGAFDGCTALEQRLSDGLNYNAHTVTWLQQRFNNLPLHQSLYNATTLTTTRLSELIQQYRSTLDTTDAMGMTPLHVLCSNPNIGSLEMIQILTDAEPEVALMATVTGYTPLITSDEEGGNDGNDSDGEEYLSDNDNGNEGNNDEEEGGNDGNDNIGQNVGTRPWRTVIEQLRGNRYYFDDRSTLSIIRQRIECHGRSASTEELEELIDMYPKELAFSLLLCTLRFPVHSRILMDKIFHAIEDYSKEQMDYCIQKFQGDRDKEKTADTVIGEAMTLIFSFFDDYTANAQSGNLEAMYLVRQRYPKSILYIDAHEFTPLHGVCCVLNMDIFRYFIKWHLQVNPKGRGGLYDMNDSGISSMDTLIDTQMDIVTQLRWLGSHALLESKDVEKWLLVHRSAHSSSLKTIKFFIDLYPSGVMSQDDDWNLPITLHLGLRYRPRNSFSDEDYAITKLLITKGIEYGGIDTIGGLFHKEPDEDKSCTLDALLKEVGKASREKLWGMIDEWIEEAAGGDYTIAPIVHAALLNRKHMSASLFEFVLKRYGANSEANEYGILPLMFAVQQEVKWDGGVCHIFKENLNELNSVDVESQLPILPFAASRKNPDVSTLYEFARHSPWMFDN